MKIHDQANDTTIVLCRTIWVTREMSIWKQKRVQIWKENIIMSGPKLAISSMAARTSWSIVQSLHFNRAKANWDLILGSNANPWKVSSCPWTQPERLRHVSVYGCVKWSLSSSARPVSDQASATDTPFEHSPRGTENQSATMTLLGNDWPCDWNFKARLPQENTKQKPLFQ